MQNQIRALLVVLIFIGLLLLALGIYIAFFKKPIENSATNVSATVENTAPTTTSANTSSKVNLILNGTDNWKDSGLTVKKGQTVNVSASGSVVWDQDKPPVGPEGTYPANQVESPNDFPLPSAGCGSLLMRIGNEKFPVGARATITARDNGKIEFVVNDRTAYLFNNSGNFQIQVSIQ